jgi:mono/diheme cytochrome c family protein
MRRRSMISRSMGSAVLAIVAGVWATAFIGTARADEKKVDFNTDIKPIFKQSCIKCHSLDNPKHKAASGFNMSSKEEAMKGGKTGKDIVPGNANDSLLYKLLLGTATVDGEDIEAMPKKKKGEDWKGLPEQQIELIKAWINQGADWPG